MSICSNNSARHSAGQSSTRSKQVDNHNMKELRTGSLRVLFIFDPVSTAVLLLGGDKREQWRAWIRNSDSDR